jgi:hypothetical protein
VTRRPEGQRSTRELEGINEFGYHKEDGETRGATARKRSRKSRPSIPEKQKETTPEFIASIAVVLVTGLFIITFTLQAFTIPSSSMENTLLIGDHVFVDEFCWRQWQSGSAS